MPPYRQTPHPLHIRYKILAFRLGLEEDAYPPLDTFVTQYNKKLGRQSGLQGENHVIRELAMDKDERERGQLKSAAMDRLPDQKTSL